MVAKLSVSVQRGTRRSTDLLNFDVKVTHLGVMVLGYGLEASNNYKQNNSTHSLSLHGGQRTCSPTSKSYARIAITATDSCVLRCLTLSMAQNEQAVGYWMVERSNPTKPIQNYRCSNSHNNSALKNMRKQFIHTHHSSRLPTENTASASAPWRRLEYWVH